MKPCKQCGAQILDDAYTCPLCGARAEIKPFRSTRTIIIDIIQTIIVIVLVISVIAAVIFGFYYETVLKYKYANIDIVKGYVPYPDDKNLSYTCGEILDKYITGIKWDIFEFTAIRQDTLGNNIKNDAFDIDISGKAKGTNTPLQIDMRLYLCKESETSDKVIGTSFRLKNIKWGEEYLTIEEAKIFWRALFVAYNEGYTDLSNFEYLVNALPFPETFTDENYGMTFQYPEEWEMAEYPEENFSNEIKRIAEISPPEIDTKETTKFIVSLVNKIPFDMDTDDQEKVEKAVYKENSTLLAYGNIWLEDIDGKSITYQTGNSQEVTIVYYMIGEEIYQITAFCDPSFSYVYSDVFSKMIKSYALTESVKEKLLEEEMKKQAEEEARKAAEEEARKAAELAALPELYYGWLEWIEAPHLVKNRGLQYIEGVIRKNVGMNWDVSIEFILFDENGYQIGTASDYISEFKNGVSWKFSTLVTSDCASFEFSKLDVY